MDFAPGRYEGRIGNRRGEYITTDGEQFVPWLGGVPRQATDFDELRVVSEGHLPALGRVYSSIDIDPAKVRTLYHLPTVVSEYTLPDGGTVSTANSHGNIQCNGGDSLVWNKSRRPWLVEAEGMPDNYGDYETWKAAALALIAEVEGHT